MRVSRALVLLVLLPTTAHAQSKVMVDKRPVQVERKTFDPDNLPNPPPPLRPGEIAECESLYKIDLTPRYTPGEAAPAADGGGVRVPVRIDSVRVQLRLVVTIWIPKNPEPRVKPHEEGHRAVAEYYYKDAHKHAQAAAQALIGQTVEGEGKTKELA